MKVKILIVLILLIVMIGMIAFHFSDKPLNKSITIDKIVVEKSKRKLYLYSNGKVIKTYRIALGRNPVGDKKFEGDKKTPEGIYYINDKSPNSNYHKNLGISYPNEQDIAEARKLGKNPGGQIKIHGLNNKYHWIGKLHLLTNWTAGCIAVTDKEIDELYEVIKIGTPIEIEE